MHKLSDSELIEELKSRFEENTRTLEALKKVHEKIVEVNKKLQESEAMKSNFLSNIRNEINNPLTSILCISKVLVDSESPARDTVASMAGSIHSEAFNLDFQIRNIFAAAELEAGELPLSISRADIDTLIYSAIDAFIHKANDKKITVSFDSLAVSGADPSFMTDPEKIQLAVTNLLSNAIEYSNESGKVEIKAWRDGENLNISVKDHGIGIDESDHQVVFDRFKQLDSGVAKSHLGHGLGASVTKAAIELLNGTVSLVSAKDQGSTFTVSVPEAQGDAGADMYSGDSNEFFFEVEEEKEF